MFQPIESRMIASTEDSLAVLTRQFVAQLPARIEAIQTQFQLIDLAHWQATDVHTLHRLVHNVTGAAGTFGMGAVSDAARMLETRLADLLACGITPAPGQWRHVALAMAQLRSVARQQQNANGINLQPQISPTYEHEQRLLLDLVEDDVQQANFLAAALTAADFRLRIFASIDDFRQLHLAQANERPAAVIMDMGFPEGDAAGANAIAELGMGKDSGIPVIFISVRDDLRARLTAYRAGATRYLSKPIDTARLCRLLEEVTERLPAEPYRVLLIDDDIALLELYSIFLRQAGIEVHAESVPLQSLDALKSFKPDVVVLDMYMPDASGPELAAVLREQDAFAQTPILFLSAELDIDKQLLALNLGGDDFLVKPIVPAHLVAAVTARARRARQNVETTQRLQRALYEREREHMALDKHALVSIADPEGKITYANDNFCSISGYSRSELLGQDHRILKSGKHSVDFYRDLWLALKSGNIWRGEICNAKKDGTLYWVSATITPFLDNTGNIYQYVSIRTDITTLKQSQEALRSSKERLRRGQIFANIGTWDWNIANGELIWSERIPALFGHAEGALATSYENFLRAVHPDDRQAVTDAINACIERNVPYEVEHRVVWPNGDVRWLLERGAVVRNAAGEVVQMLGVVQDIHERKLAQLWLEESEKRLREAQSLAHLGNWRAELDSGMQYWSEEMYNIFGRDKDNFTPNVDNFHAAVHPEDVALVTASVAQAQHTGLYDVTYRLIRPDGQLRYVHELARAEHDTDGRMIRLIGTVQDITESKLAEAELERLRLRLQLAAEASGVGIWDFDVANNRLNWDSAMFRLYGDNEAQFSGALDAWQKCLHPDDIERANQELQSALRGETVFDTQFRVVWANGRTRWIHGKGYVERDAGGQPLRMIGTNWDITDHKDFERALLASKQEAERANLAKSQFLSSMSHELRTPLNAIIGFSQILEVDDSLDEAQLDSVQEIIKAGQHLLDLINELLDLAKVESGNIKLNIDKVNLAELVTDCLHLIMPLANARQISVHINVPPETSVRADRTRLKQVLLNLLSNAVKYNREAGSIDLFAQELPPHSASQGYLRITVQDTGEGIPPERMGELFQPFGRLNAEHSEIEGTGIGLTITRQLVQLMGGEVGVNNLPQGGSAFWVELPCACESKQMQLATHATQSTDPAFAQVDSAAPEDRNKLHRVLWIDDDPVTLKLVAQLPGIRNCINLFTASTAQAGLELALLQQPQLILLDINMPDIDGYQTLSTLKNMPSLRTVPILAVTSNAMPDEIQRGIAAGFSAYLTKPIIVDLLLQTMDQCLQQSQEGNL